MNEKLDLQELCIETRKIAAEAAQFIRTESTLFDSSKIEYKSSNDLVSYVDKETEKMLVLKLKQLLPIAGFITEEGTVEQSKEGLKWVIDPLDGTTNFMHKLTPYSVSLALMNDEEVLLGVVHEIALNESYYAWKNGGAWCNDKPIKVSNCPSLSHALIVVGFPYSMNNHKEAYFEIVKELVSTTHGVRRLGSAAADLVYLAAGKLEAYLEFNINIWDMAAGLLILEEAGGTLTDFRNTHQQRMGKRILATNSHIHQELLELVNRYWEE